MEPRRARLRRSISGLYYNLDLRPRSCAAALVATARRGRGSCQVAGSKGERSAASVHAPVGAFVLRPAEYALALVRGSTSGGCAAENELMVLFV